MSATGKSKRQALGIELRPPLGLIPLVALLAFGLCGCGDKPSAQAAAAPPPVTVAPPTKRTVTDWDEFTGRFETSTR